MINYKAIRAFVANGVQYEAGDSVPASSFYNLQSLLNCKMIIESKKKAIEVPITMQAVKKHPIKLRNKK